MGCERAESLSEATGSPRMPSKQINQEITVKFIYKSGGKWQKRQLKVECGCLSEGD